MNQDVEHIKLLSIFYYVVGGLMGLFACFPFIHLVIGILMLTDSFGSVGTPPPPFIAWIFIIVAVFIIMLGWSLAICMIITGLCLSRHIRYKFCFVTACISCIFMPFGTVLGVMTIIVLSRPSVKELFGVLKLP